jgi:eukaryotic-like serine/threonine-protein kinase
VNRCPHCGQNHSNTNHFCPVTGKPIELGPRLVSVNLLDRFKVIKVLGKGPIGIVVEVEDKRSKGRFAAKLIHPQYTRDAEAAKRMLADMGRLREVHCHHVAKVVTVGRDTGAAITVVRELMTGHCLSTRIAQVGQFSLRAAFFIVREILLALDAIHAKGILNLDLSPADVFLAKSNTGSTVKIVDIGEHHIKKDLSGRSLVNYNYYAPEQMDKSRQPSAKADIYAAGAILFEMLTGAPPSAESQPLKTVRRDLTPEITALVTRAIDPNSAKRFESAKAFIAALDKANEAIAGLTSQPPPPASPGPSPTAKDASAGSPPPGTAPASPGPVQIAAEYRAAAAAREVPVTQGTSGQGAPGAPPVAPDPPLPAPPTTPLPASPQSGISAPQVQAPAPGMQRDAVEGAPPRQPAESPPSAGAPQGRPVPGSHQEPAAPRQQSVPDGRESVIVEMPEIHRGVRSRKSLIAVVTLLVIAAAAAGYFINEQSALDKANATPKEVEITIEVMPKHAVISVDGKRMMGNPVTMKVVPDTRLHTILAKADGFEQKERDIPFDEARTIQLDLAEIIQPDEPAGGEPAAVVEEEAAAIQEVEAVTPPTPEVPASPPSAAPEDTPVEADSVKPPIHKQPSVKRARTAKTPAKKSRASAPAGSSKSKTTKKTSGKAEKSKVEGFRTSNPFD